MVKFCTNCGSQLEDSAVFCTNCGTKVDETYNQSVDEVVETTGNKYLQIKDKASGDYSSVKNVLQKSGERIDAHRSHLPDGIINKSKDLIKTDLEFPDELVNEKPVFEINGNMGSKLLVYDDRCAIETIKGVRSAAFRGVKGLTAGSKEFYYKDLTSVQFKNVGKTTGYLMFEFAGSHSVSRMKDENSFIFAATYGTSKYKLLKEKMPMVHRYIQERIKESKHVNSAPIVQNQASDADELLKFKQLLDAGVITQEEFDAKKKQILGL